MTLESLMEIPRIYTALAEWIACIIYIFILPKKYSGFRFWCVLISTCFLFGAYQYIAGILPLYLWIPGMLGAIVLMYLFIYLSTDTNWKDASFCCIRAFVLAEFAASLHWQLYVWIILKIESPNIWIKIASLAFIYVSVFLLYFLLEREHIPKEERINVNTKELSGAVLIAFSAFTISNLSFIMPDTPFSGVSTSILYVRTLVDFGGIVMLFAQQDKREELRMRSENQSMNIVLQRQYDQYRLSIDNIEMLRREFHDLKHYMIAIRSESDPEKKEQYLSEMEQAILTQEAFYHTGNSVLDVVLTTKSTYCVQNNIRFTCMADGKLISFMHVKDICSIFGNALDNAIECVSQYPDLDKRLISLSLSKKNQFLMIQCENYMEKNISFNKNGLPSTTKKDKENHGYGLKSIQYAVSKYGGSMALHSENHWFTLQILIPLEHV